MFNYSFNFCENADASICGQLLLESPFIHNNISFRKGMIEVENGNVMEVIFTHSRATTAFIYTSEQNISSSYRAILGYEADSERERVVLPGQLILGAERTALVQQGIADLLQSPALEELFKVKKQENIITLPVLREGMKYGLTEKIFENYGYYCNEVVSDAHHTVDEAETIYRRKVTQTLFKDADLTERGRRQVDTAMVADSIASGTVLLGVIKSLGQRLEGIKQLELISPLATLRGLARIAWYASKQQKIRAHVFETLLNPLPPDFYYSAHFPESQFHIDADAQSAYQKWWGEDGRGQKIADTACAGYGWSEAFFAPEKQIQMIEEELQERHGLTINTIISRNCD